MIVLLRMQDGAIMLPGSVLFLLGPGARSWSLSPSAASPSAVRLPRLRRAPTRVRCVRSGDSSGRPRRSAAARQRPFDESAGHPGGC